MRQELTGGWPRASQGLDVMAMDPLGQGYDIVLIYFNIGVGLKLGKSPGLHMAMVKDEVVGQPIVQMIPEARVKLLHLLTVSK